MNVTNDAQAVFDVVVPVLYADTTLPRRALYIQAGAMYNDSHRVIKRTTFWGEEVDHLPKHYYLNGLGDITEEQMSLIYENKEVARIMSLNSSNILSTSRMRTILPVRDAMNHRNVFKNGYTMVCGSDIEVINVTDGHSVRVEWPVDFGFAEKLVAVKDVLDLSYFPYNFMQTEKLYNLKYIKLYNAQFNIELKDSPLLQEECLLYMIENFCDKVDGNYVIVLHPAVYAKCEEDGEWHKNIKSALTAKNLQMVNGGSINVACA